jgi:hypothetical protein
MPEYDRLSNAIEWFGLWFVERRRTPQGAIQVGIPCHLPVMLSQMQFIGNLGVNRSHVAIQNWRIGRDTTHTDSVI